MKFINLNKIKTTINKFIYTILVLLLLIQIILSMINPIASFSVEIESDNIIEGSNENNGEYEEYEMYNSYDDNNIENENFLSSNNTNEDTINTETDDENINNIITADTNVNDTDVTYDISSNVTETEEIEETQTLMASSAYSFTGSLTTVTSDTIIDSAYGWTFKFIAGSTTVTSGGMTNYAVDYNKHTSAGSSTLDSSIYLSARLTSTSQKGKIWVRYNNVGTYNGQIIDLKITLSDWSNIQKANTSANSLIGGVNYPCVFFKKTAIDVLTTSSPAVDSPVWTYTFYKHDTNTEISVKGSATFMDLDPGEYFVAENGFTKAMYVTSTTAITRETRNGNISYGTQYGGSGVADSNKNNWVTFLFSGSSFSFIYTREEDIFGNSIRNVTGTGPSLSRNMYHYLLSSESLVLIDTPNPIKEVSDVEVYGENEFYYTISQFIPTESSDFYFDAYILSDLIDPCLEVIDYIIIDDSSTDRSSWFDYLSVIDEDTGGTTLSFTANKLSSSSFYNNNYYFKITVKKKSGYDMSSYLVDDKCTVYNSASKYQVTTQGESFVNTNTVETSFYADISTKVTNGVIDNSIDKIPFGSSITINYEPNDGYFLESIFVNGENINIDNKNNNDNEDDENENTDINLSYTISNIILSHYDIEVIYQKVGTLIIYKTNASGSYLSGAEFMLEAEDGSIKISGETADDGKIIFENLHNGTYILIETKAPDGYELSKESYTFEIEDGETVEYTIQNMKKTVLPIAGGSGWIIFSFLGILFIILSIVLTVILKKKENKKIEEKKAYLKSRI